MVYSQEASALKKFTGKAYILDVNCGYTFEFGPRDPPYITLALIPAKDETPESVYTTLVSLISSGVVQITIEADDEVQ